MPRCSPWLVNATLPITSHLLSGPHLSFSAQTTGPGQPVWKTSATTCTPRWSGRNLSGTRSLLRGMALALANQWWHTNEWQEHYRWFEKAVDQVTVLPPSQQAEMFAHFGHVAIRLSRYDEGRPVLQASLEVSTSQGESPQPLALLTLATDAIEAGKAAEAIVLAQQAAEAAQTRNERFWHGYALAARSVMISSSSDEDALPLATQALSEAHDVGNEWLIATALFAGGEASVRVDSVRAISLLDQALALTTRGGDQYTAAQAMFFRGVAHLRARQIPDAACDLSEALARMQALGGGYYTATVLSAIASLLAHQNHPEEAVRVLEHSMVCAIGGAFPARPKTSARNSAYGTDSNESSTTLRSSNCGPKPGPGASMKPSNGRTPRSSTCP